MEIPKFLEEKLIKQYNEDIFKQIKDGYKEKRVLTFRVNTLKATIKEIQNILEQNNIEYENVEWSKEAFIIKNVDKSVIQNLDIYKSGKIYLQSLSSMLPPIILQPKEKTDILDMAAAPGGKTTQIAALTNNNANITACEMNKIRAEKLKYNIEKQGASVYVMEVDSRNIDNFFSFDSILLDAPCSGSGIIDLEDSNLEKNFTLNLINKTVGLQKVLIQKAVTILKKDKEMIYSTCSILQEENEDIVNEILKTNKVEVVPINFEGMEALPLLPTKIDGTICIAPNKLYEGFFVAKLRKK